MYKIFTTLISLGLLFLSLLLIGGFLWIRANGFDLPDYNQLASYEPPVTTRLYAADGQILMEYSYEKRIFVPEEKIPELVKQAFISAEDKHFYSHFGVDLFGLTRAIITNVKNYIEGKRFIGASTITQQVAKNFLLTKERSIVRKIKEAILSYRMTRSFSKGHVLELYLNEIYLGNRAYGVAAASLNYFNKSLDELTIQEAAYLAALPKGPNNYNPKTKYNQAIGRRNWVIGRMQEDGYITIQEAEKAKKSALETVEHKTKYIEEAKYFSDEVRRVVTKSLGEDSVFEGGLIVRTTVNPILQSIATDTFQKGIVDYDKRHGYRPNGIKINIDDNYKTTLKETKLPTGGLDFWHKAVVLKIDETSKEPKAIIELEDGSEGKILLKHLAWAKENLEDQKVGPKPTKVSEVLNIGDVIYVETYNKEQNLFALRQVPDAEGAMIVMNPHTGKVLAMVGGFDFNKSEFNRVTQAFRQTGSVFKPVVYTTALELGYSPTDLILDAPFVLNQGVGLPLWKPSNYSKGFSGLTTLRQGIEKSKNLMTVRLAQDIGMDKVAEMTKRLGVNDNLPPYLSMSLGAADTRLIDIVKAYSTFANGGKKITPYLIEQIQDRYGKSIFKNNTNTCTNCNVNSYSKDIELPIITDNREQILDELTAYQITSILNGVAVRGTGARLRGINKNLAGKTGTTNDTKDAWFIGYSPDMVVGVYVGFDAPRTLGKVETGAAAALPIFYDFMNKALENQPNLDFKVPKGIRFMRINPTTGQPATIDDTVVITEALKPDFDFNNTQRVIGQDGKSMLDDILEDANEFSLGTEY